MTNNNTDDLSALRTQIDDIDEQLVKLLNERARLALQVGIIKKGENIYRPRREAEVLKHVVQASDGPLSDEALKRIFEAVILVCRTIQHTK